MIDDKRLRAKARAAMLAGTLPSRRPDRSWGGSGSGDQCPICGLQLDRDYLELELELDGDGAGEPKTLEGIETASAPDVVKHVDGELLDGFEREPLVFGRLTARCR